MVSSGLRLAAIIVSFAFCSHGATDENAAVFNLAQRFFSDSLYNLAFEQYQKYNGVKHPAQNDATVLFNMAQCQFKLDNMRKAAEGFEEFVKEFPDDEKMMDAMSGAAASRKSLNDLREASDWYFLLWSHFPKSDLGQRSLFEAARCAENDKNQERAAELYEKYLQKIPQNEKSKIASIALIRILIVQKEYPHAQELLAQYEKQWTSDLVFSAQRLFYAALCAQKMQNNDLASALYSRLLQASGVMIIPEYQDACIQAISLLESQRKYEATIDVYKKLYEYLCSHKQKISWELLFAWAENSRKARKFADAETIYCRLINIYPDQGKGNIVLFRIAECQAGGNNLASAIETLEKLALLDSTGEYGARAVQKIGDLYAARSLHSSALAAYRRYLLMPNRPDKDAVTYRIGVTLQEKFQRFGAAIHEYENILQRYPQSSYVFQAMLAQARCYEELKNYSAAIQNYEYLIESGAVSSIAALSRERIDYIETYCQKDAQSAAYGLAKILEQDPDSLTKRSRYWRLAEIYRDDLRDFEHALTLFEKIEKSPDITDSLMVMVIYEKARLYEKLYEKSRIDGQSASAAYTKERALALYRSLVSRYPSSPSADDAAFRMMIMDSPGIKAFEKFVAGYPASSHVAEVLSYIAEYYESITTDSTDRAHFSSAFAADAQILRCFPQSVYASDALLGSARLLLLVGQKDSARIMALNAQARYPGTTTEAEAMFLLGTISRRSGDAAAAAEMYKKVIYRYPLSQCSQEARFELASVQFAQGKLLDALNNFRFYVQNVSAGKNLLAARFGIGRCLVRTGVIDEAKELFADLLREEPPSSIVAAINHEQGAMAERSGDIPTALSWYKRAIELPGYQERGALLIHVAQLYFDNRIYDEAVRTYDAALKTATAAGDSITIMTGAIVSLIMEGQQKTADRRIADFKASFGENDLAIAKITYHEGLAMQNSRNFDGAIKRYKYIISRFDSSQYCDDALYQMAICSQNNGFNDKSIEFFEELLSKYPNSIYRGLTRFKIAMMYHDQSDYVRAAELFVLVSGDQTADKSLRFRAAYNASIDYQKMSEWTQAVKIYQEILDNFSGELPASSLNLKMGFCLLQARRFDEALDKFVLSELDPDPQDRPEIMYWIGTCYANMNDYSRAITEFLKIPLLSVGAEKWASTAQFEAARLYERTGDYSKARALYAKILAADGEQGKFGKQAGVRIERLNSLMAENGK